MDVSLCPAAGVSFFIQGCRFGLLAKSYLFDLFRGSLARKFQGRFALSFGYCIVCAILWLGCLATLSSLLLIAQAGLICCFESREKGGPIMLDACPLLGDDDLLHVCAHSLHCHTLVDSYRWKRSDQPKQLRSLASPQV